MKVARLYDFLDVRIEEQPVPTIGPGEALVRARACGICSGDVVPWYIRKKAPLVFGHEPVGEIAEVGAGVSGFRPGDRVFVHHHAPCFRCRACARGEFVQCPTWKQSHLDPGGMAEFFRVPAGNLAGDTLHLPDHVSDADGALVEPLACVVKSLARAGDVAGATVLIIGLGVMGQLHVLLARHLGATRILAADLVAGRCAMAVQLGADLAIDASAAPLADQVRDATDGEGAEIVIVGPATVAALEVGIACAARGGTVVQFMGTEPGETLALPTFDFYFRELRLVPSYSCGPVETRQALDLITQGVIAARHVVTHRFPLDEAAEAYRVAALDKAAIKALVMFGGARG
ncbi:MAG TPA: alcohol dehydrogenase catalytic domain-containing protein [Candidatus Dormibacteraeota bacterium]|nr:alcohol dehydrogenase catalytic domain-containing protein [Candidatus Dormibacteraeota bacterium]